MNEEFAARIAERFPEGLCGVFAVGATRRTYIMEQNRAASDPGFIGDFAVQTAFLFDRYMGLISLYFGLGGQYMIIPGLSYRSLFERGEEYARVIIPEAFNLIGEKWIDFYHRENIDPYFAGLEAMLLLPSGTAPHEAALALRKFQETWPYQEGKRKLIWEIASLPLLAVLQSFTGLAASEIEEFEKPLNSGTELDNLSRNLYRRLSRSVYGTDVPMPHFYLGTCMSGDLKPRAPLIFSLTGGDYLRMFYTPYPTLYISEDGLREILEDLAFRERFHSEGTDYRGKYSAELVEREYQRVLALAEDVNSTLGLARRMPE